MTRALHPSVAAVRRAVRRVLAPLDPGSVVVVACSGGADSTALAAAAVVEGHRAGLRVVGVTVDHGLQPGSADVADRVVATLAALGADETTTARVTVASGSGLGPEAAAREARYAVLAQVAEHHGAALVLLGHTLDDQAETVLLGLARGSGGRSLAGMRPAFDRFARPLLGVRRDDTRTACQVEGLPVWEDPHNTDAGYARVRVRRRVLPALEDALGPGVTEALARTAEALREDTSYLDGVAAAAHDEARRDDGLEVAVLATLHPAVRRRVLHRAALAAGVPPAELTRDHVLAVDALVTDWRGQRWIDLPGHRRAVRRDGVLLLGPADA